MASSYTATVLYSVSGTLPGESDPNVVQFAAGGQVVSFANDSVHGGNQAQYQSAPGGTVTLLRPNSGPFVFDSIAYGTNGSQQVGWVVNNTNGTEQAALWNGSAGTFVDLDPSATLGGAGVSYQSEAFATSGSQQVGEYQPNISDFAVLWNGSAGSAVSLQPTKLGRVNSSDAIGTDGTNQVGYGQVGGITTALLWSGTAASAVNLDPAGGVYNSLHANAVSGNEEVGYGLLSSNAFQHALVWTGTANSLVDINPPTFQESDALGTNGTEAVGYGDTSASSNANQALLWTGQASTTAIDLQSLLPTGYSTSVAYSIDATGDVFGVATNASGNSFAVEWVPVVPEPTSAIILAAVSCMVLGGRRRVRPA